MLSPSVGKYCVSLAALAAAVAAPAYAQEASGAGAGALEEIVVTAQKRVQNLQDVPIVVTTVNADLVRDTGVRDVKDLQLLVPGLTVTSTTHEASTTARIRGIGTVGDNPGLESSVGVVIDGVYRPRNGVGFGDLGEVERIEVLKGPQSTLFGKSTSAGVINILSAAPSFDFGVDAEATVGNYDAHGAAISVTGPLVEEKLAGRLFVARRKRDGFLDVVTGAGPRTETEDMDQDYWTARGQLLFRPNDRLSVRAIADYTKRDENCCGTVPILIGDSPVSRAVIVNSVRPGSTPLTPDPFNRTTYLNRQTTSKLDDRGLSAQVDYDFGGAALTSVTAIRKWDNARGQDSDLTAADILYRPDESYTDHFKTFSQELRLGGDTGRLNWLVGLFYSDEDYDGVAPLTYGTDYYTFLATRLLGGLPALIGALPTNTFMPGAGQNDSFSQDNKTWALFTNNTLDLTDKWDVTVGLRYTEDKKTLDSVYRTTGGSCARARAAFPVLAARVGAAAAAQAVGNLCISWENEAFDALSGRQSRKDTEWSGTLKTSYRWTPDVMTYASYARGFKAGGFNFDRPLATFGVGAAGFTMSINPSTAFPAETADAFELGAKTQLFDRRLILNAALFHQTYHDFQLNTFLGTSFIVESIPKVRSKGVDVDFLWRTGVQGLTIQGGVTYAVTQYAPFTAADLAAGQNFAGLARLPGSRVSFAPLWSGSLAATYETPITASLIARANLSGKYSSAYNTGSDLAPQKMQGETFVVNGRIGVGAENGRWMLEAWANNLFDEDYYQVAINQTLQGQESDPANIRTYAAFLAQPRTYGLTLRLRY